MADPTNPAAPARPGSVSISSYLLYLYAALGLIGVVVQLSVLGTTSDVYREAYEGTTAEGGEVFVTVTTVIVAVVGLLFAVAFVVLAVLNNRAKNASRIVTWVLGGISLCCSGVGLASTAFTNSMDFGSTDSDVPSPSEIQSRLEDALPSWYMPTSITLTVLALLALLAALILLALPPSNEFFRKPAPAWEPPVPGSAYPAYPPPATPPTASPAPGAPPATGSTPPPPAEPPNEQPGPQSPPPGQ
ncbi:hypothetical protein [Phytohabitans rumicis]|uniref:Uncharacterized protein n=1 Tax=Phytohabitans rumicis TaxID=1076125 RepID=A0A6V8KZC5_9ACTN|nr:hypothetical protein [Phytohabitans rumicis]GFJ90443.1 hypothetical protein Prum_040850 [Phytohabitans rumicis]